MTKTAQPVPSTPEWSIQQQNVARLLAIGYTQTMAADRVGLALRTVQRWCADPRYAAYVQELHEYAWRRVEPGIMANVMLAIDVQRRMLLGEIKADDKRYREAARIIDRILDRLLYVEPPEDADRPRQVGAAVQVNVGRTGD